MEEEQSQIIPSKKELKKQRKEETLEARAHADRKRMMMKSSAVAVIVLAIVGVIAAVVLTRDTATSMSDVTPDPIEGPIDAKVVVRIYEDFQCPACGAVYPALKDIIAEYKDRVKFVFNDFPLPQHKNATIAAVAAQCAMAQNKYMDMSDKLYGGQNDWGEKSNQRAQEIISDYAKEIGLDETQFNTCVTSQPPADSINEDLAEGRKLGVNSTPSFFVGDTRVTETPFSSNVRKEIENALNAQ